MIIPVVYGQNSLLPVLVLTDALIYQYVYRAYRRGLRLKYLIIWSTGAVSQNYRWVEVFCYRFSLFTRSFYCSFSPSRLGRLGVKLLAS
jgi:hypothetical protein